LTLEIEVPRVFLPLLKPARYKGIHGGRGGAKSHFFAKRLITLCYAKPLRAVCIREVQNSLKESVRQLLVDKIQELGLGAFFEVVESEIRGRNGSLIIFRGMQVYNAENIKSLENYDIAWVEEAQTFSAKSLRLLRPTIRNESSELWFSWNPRYDSDPIDLFFRGASRYPGAVCVESNWRDNPWFPQVLKDERESDLAADPEMAEHVWGGGYEIISEGAYYARMIAVAEKEGRIGHFPYDTSFPVETAWDIGVDDYTAIWFIQDDGFTSTAIDYYEVSGDGAEEIVKNSLPELCPDPSDTKAGLIALDRAVPFGYGTHFLPHDVKNREWGAGARSRVEILMGLGLRKIVKGANQGPEERIASSRKILPTMRFHLTPRVQLGLSRLRRYCRKFNDALGTYTTPLHDINSHGADAFGEYAVNRAIRPPKPPPIPTRYALPGQVRLPGPPEPPTGKRIKI
jgi:phage terminase large subunit